MKAKTISTLMLFLIGAPFVFLSSVADADDSPLSGSWADNAADSGKYEPINYVSRQEPASSKWANSNASQPASSGLQQMAKAPASSHASLDDLLGEDALTGDIDEPEEVAAMDDDYEMMDDMSVYDDSNDESMDSYVDEEETEDSSMMDSEMHRAMEPKARTLPEICEEVQCKRCDTRSCPAPRSTCAPKCASPCSTSRETCKPKTCGSTCAPRSCAPCDYGRNRGGDMGRGRGRMHGGDGGSGRGRGDVDGGSGGGGRDDSDHGGGGGGGEFGGEGGGGGDLVVHGGQGGGGYLGEGELITIDFPEEEIRVILRSIADMFDLNLVVPETLVGRTSIKLKNVEWRQVFDIVLKPAGYTFTEEKNIIRVISLDQINQEPMTVRTFIIKYAKASEIAQSIAPLIEIKGGGSIQIDGRSNSIIVRERPSVILQIENLLKNSGLDEPSTQVMIETKFIEVGCSEGEGGTDGAGFDFWSSGGPFSEGQRFAQWGTNSKVNVAGTLEDACISMANQVGCFLSPETYLKTAVFSAETFSIVLQALKTNKSTNLVANPTVVVMNNHTCEIHVGKDEPIPEPTINETTGKFEIGQVEYMPIGVSLKVIPRVNHGAEQITLEIDPEVSRVETYREFLGVKYPVKTVRQAHSVISIKNGYTVALGGLTQEDTIEIERRVPLVGSIPLIGRIFRNTRDEISKTNLIMFLTAKTLSHDGTYMDIVDPRVMSRMGIGPQDLPGYANGIPVEGLNKMSGQHMNALQAQQNMRNSAYDRGAVSRIRKQTSEESERQTKKRRRCGRVRDYSRTM